MRDPGSRPSLEKMYVHRSCQFGYSGVTGVSFAPDLRISR